MTISTIDSTVCKHENVTWRYKALGTVAIINGFIHADCDDCKEFLMLPVVNYTSVDIAEMVTTAAKRTEEEVSQSRPHD